MESYLRENGVETSKLEEALFIRSLLLKILTPP